MGQKLPPTSLYMPTGIALCFSIICSPWEMGGRKKGGEGRNTIAESHAAKFNIGKGVTVKYSPLAHDSECPLAYSRSTVTRGLDVVRILQRRKEKSFSSLSPLPDRPR